MRYQCLAQDNMRYQKRIFPVYQLKSCQQQGMHYNKNHAWKIFQDHIHFT